MTGMGISRLTVKKILNHVERDVTAIYDRHSYDPEKRTALEAWGRRLEAIVSGATGEGSVTVVPAISRSGRELGWRHGAER
jgi:hypothetical protein